MKHSIKKSPGSQIELEVELTKDEFNHYWQSVYDEAIASVELKGFRRGTAPKDLADKAIDRSKVFEKAAGEAVKFSLNGLIEDNNWTMIDQPKIEIISSDNGLKYKGVLTIFPEVKLDNYQPIVHEINQETKRQIEQIKVEEKDIDQTLEWLRNSRAISKSVNRPAKKGDLVEFEVESLGQKNHDHFIIGQGRYLPGFEEKIIDHQAGDQLKFSLTVPLDYWQADLQGKTIDFQVALKNVLERELPALNDDFAQKLGNFKNLSDLREKTRSSVKLEKEEKEKEKGRIKILEKFSEKAEIDLPKTMIEKTLDALVKQSEASWRAAGKSEEAVRQDLASAASRKVKSHLIINKITQDKNLEPAKEEVEQEIGKYQYEKDKLDSQKFYDYIYGVIQNRKVFNYLESL